jgi:hypothetical protein
MNDPIAVALKFGFLAVLYLFLLWVAVSARRDLRRAGGGAMELAEPPLPPGVPRRERSGPDLRAGVSPHLVVIAALGREPGEVVPIHGSATLGRSENAELQIDDPFASSAHARIFPREEFMYIEDMGSTNGTFLNGRQLRRPERLKVADVIRIGETEYRYQE